MVRETAGVVAYAAGDFALALRELRTATRLGVGGHLLPLIVDCERALGRPDRALELAAGADGLDVDTRAELAIVVSGIHRDAGDPAAALAALADPPTGVTGDTALRWRYARAAALESGEDSEAAQEIFARLAADDTGGVTDAAERLAAVHGLLFDDLAEDSTDDLPAGELPDGSDDPAAGDLVSEGHDDGGHDDADVHGDDAHGRDGPGEDGPGHDGQDRSARDQDGHGRDARDQDAQPEHEDRGGPDNDQDH